MCSDSWDVRIAMHWSWQPLAWFGRTTTWRVVRVARTTLCPNQLPRSDQVILHPSLAKVRGNSIVTSALTPHYDNHPARITTPSNNAYTATVICPLLTTFHHKKYWGEVKIRKAKISTEDPICTTDEGPVENPWWQSLWALLGWDMRSACLLLS